MSAGGWRRKPKKPAAGRKPKAAPRPAKPAAAPVRLGKAPGYGTAADRLEMDW